MSDFTTANISELRARPLDAQGLWEVSFRSDNAGMAHQLYADGRLVDWTETADARRLTFEAPGPVELAIAAVAPHLATCDFSHLLDMPQSSAWRCEIRVVRGHAMPAGTVVEIYGDHAGGLVDMSTPLVSRQLWPDAQPRWAWGQDRFARGGFGIDGSQGPGFGCGGLGAGIMGVGAHVARIDLALPEHGVHQLLVRHSCPDGRTSDAVVQTVHSSPPSPPPVSMTLLAYDHVTQRVTLQIEE